MHSENFACKPPLLCPLHDRSSPVVHSKRDGEQLEKAQPERDAAREDSGVLDLIDKMRVARVTPSICAAVGRELGGLSFVARLLDRRRVDAVERGALPVVLDSDLLPDIHPTPPCLDGVKLLLLARHHHGRAH